METPQSLSQFVVDAFTTTIFHGNPAAVCPLQAWLPEALMQQIAAENNLSETAFAVPEGTSWGLRWFTPTVEIELCGHATLATAFVLARSLPQQQEFRFNTLSGELTVTKAGELFTLNFPQRLLQPLPQQQALSACLGVPVLQVTRAGKTIIAELTDATTVQHFIPDFFKIQALDCSGLIITARGIDCDFVSRFFAPKMGVNEDPVTGSAHCGLVPYWAEKLGKQKLHARQLSVRGGELFCEYQEGRVSMSGHAALYSEAVIFVPNT